MSDTEKPYGVMDGNRAWSVQRPVSDGPQAGAWAPRRMSDPTLAAIANWFTQAVPAPTERSKAVQIGCHLEEVSEMIAAMGMPVSAGVVNHWADSLKSGGVPPETVDRKELLDALADQIVTAVGVAHMYGLDIQGALAEVNRSNYSKFVDGKPVFDANGKITKPASYSKPDLTPFL